MFPSLSALLCFSLGLAAVAYLPHLPTFSNLVLFCAASFVLFLLHGFRASVARAAVTRPFLHPCLSVFNSRLSGPVIGLAASLILGASWAIAWGHLTINDQLAYPLEQQSIWLEGEVRGLPQEASDKTRFELVPSQAWLEGDAGRVKLQLPNRLLLSWYWHKAQRQQIKPGEHWRLKVKLKRPRGFVNFSGFDYQAWLLRRGLGASGYVLAGEPLANAGSAGLAARISLWRYQLRDWVTATSLSPQQAILVALLIGDSSGLERDDWQRMLRTGTNHLIAISGLHVGFVALMGHLLGLWLGRLLQLVWRRFPAQTYAYLAALGCAAVYSALAGFSIPTLRSLSMIGVFYLACLMRVRVAGSYLWALALALVLALDPLAVCDLGFWLSFSAVGLLLLAFSGQLRPAGAEPPWLVSYVAGFARAQWVLFIGLLVPLLYVLHTLPLLAPLANFVAIPLVTLLVVPVLLLAALVSPWWGGLAGFGLAIAGWGLECLSRFLDLLLESGQGWVNPVLGLGLAQAGLMVLAVVALVLPRGLVPRLWGWLTLAAGLAIALLPPPRSPLTLEVVDVGQGTAVIVTTARHQLVYDTGPAFSESFDAGSAILLPRLQTLGIRHLDALVLSHWDMDHAGGLDGLAAGMGTRHFYWGEPSRSGSFPASLPQGSSCHQAQPWQWDQVSFRFLSWPLSPSASANNHSCVLLISYRDQQILLPGDIEKPVEGELLRGDQLPPHLNWLLAPHHGSSTSSSPAFVAYTRPDWVVYSAGYKNRFGHPKAQVRARYQQQGSEQLNTALAGALRFSWDQEGQLQISEARTGARRYWYDPGVKAE